MYQKLIKRSADFIVSLIALLILSPIIIILILLLVIANNGKPFYFQERVGEKAKPFTIIKFKTMRDAKDKVAELADQDERVTKIGAFIRSSSLDELPQLINVLKGDMSIVGPRPLLPIYLPLYNEKQARRHSIKQGITGWAQVNGRNMLSYEEKFEYDVWYVDNISFRTDLKILFKTVQKIFTSDEIYSDKKGEAWTGWKGNSN